MELQSEFVRESEIPQLAGLLSPLTFFIIISILVFFSVVPDRNDANASPLASLLFLEPDGLNDFVGEGKDYATQLWTRSWNFEVIPDTIRSNNLTSVGISDGALSAQISGGDPYLFLLFPGVPSAINLNTGQQHPIDAAMYERVAFRFCTNATNSDQAARFFWYEGYTNGPVHYSPTIPLQSGCDLYIHDLSNHSDWQGEVTGLRLDMEGFQSGDTFTLDWARLTTYPDLSNSFEIMWEDLGPLGGTLDISIDTDASGYDGIRIAQVSNAPVIGSVSWGSSDTGHPLPQDLQQGDYYLFAEIDGQPAGYSSYPITVSQVPILRFTNPSFTSGRDYASDQGNPWDMDSSGTDGVVERCPSYSFVSGQVIAECTGPDPSFLFNVPTPIDTSFYRYFTIEFYSQHSFYDGISGGVMRLYWLNVYAHPTATEDMIINVPAAWRTYSLDLSKVPIEPYGAEYPWTSDQWAILRFDPNENQPGVLWQWRIRDAKLTGPPEADGSFIISWEIDNPEDEIVETAFFYDTDDHGLNGTPINGNRSSTLAAVQPHRTTIEKFPAQDYYTYLPLVARKACWGDCLAWNTSSLLKGEYYIYSCLDDGTNQICSYSDVPVLVK